MCSRSFQLLTRSFVMMLALLAASAALAQEEKEKPEEKPEETSKTPAASESGQSAVERGRYLVHDVAMCVVCHTPKTSDGRVITAQLLRGAPMPVSSPYRRQTWAFRAPAIAGLGGFSEEAIVTLLRTGRRPGGEEPQLPMPPFRMTEEDARAVAAYLKTVR